MGSKKTPVAATSGTSPGCSFEQIKKDLESQRETLLAEAGITGIGDSSKGGAFPDLGDQASAEANQNFTLRLLEREQKLLKKIEGALMRISNDTYGKCELCEEEISIQRLEARPVTTFCIDCKTKQEAQENIIR